MKIHLYMYIHFVTTLVTTAMLGSSEIAVTSNFNICRKITLFLSVALKHCMYWTCNEHKQRIGLHLSNLNFTGKIHICHQKSLPVLECKRAVQSIKLTWM